MPPKKGIYSVSKFFIFRGFPFLSIPPFISSIQDIPNLLNTYTGNKETLHFLHILNI